MARKMLIDGELDKSNEEETHYDFDLFVIGAGSGGVRASRFSAQYGAKVGICELPFHPISSEVIGGVGGTCVIRGCVPKKILVYGASFGPELEDARNYGWELNERIDFNWKTLLHKKTEEIVRLNGVYKRLLANAGVKLFEGEGRVIGPNEVEVIQLDGTKISYSAKHILIATGSRAQRPNIPGQESAITSDEALSLEELPKRVVVLGGGYIAVEFASIWRGMGATVDLCFRKELPLRGFDDEMRAAVARNLEGRGINMHPRTTLTELVKTEDGIKVRTDHGEEIMADVVLFATGRAANTKRLNLESVGVELDSRTGAIKVDDYSRTNIPSIWAIGDVTNRMNLTPVALMEGNCFAKTVFGGQPTAPDHSTVPCAVFCIPPLSVVGLSEEQALENANGDILVFTSTFNPMKNTISGRQEKTVMKLVVDAETDKVLGASMCGPDAPEIMQGIAIALKCGATKAQFDSTVGIHPSAAEEFVTMRSVTRRVPATLDASRSSVVSKEFKSAAENDHVWERFLPLDYQEIISTAVSPVKHATKKDIYFNLCDSPILINGGKMSFSLDKRSGNKCFMVGVRELMISWKGCWDFTPNTKSRFSEVAKLRSIGWIHIQGKIKTQMLSKDTIYAAYLVFWLERIDGLKSSNTVIRFLYDQLQNNTSKNEHIESRETEKIATMRGDGWLEIEMGKFYNGFGEDGEVEAWLTEINSPHGKSGLIVEGIEFRPV